MLGPDQMHHMTRISDALTAGQDGTSGVQGGIVTTWSSNWNEIFLQHSIFFATWARAGNLKKHFTWSSRDAKNTQLDPWREWEKSFLGLIVSFSSSIIASLRNAF